jgi:hypothetical protein
MRLDKFVARWKDVQEGTARREHAMYLAQRGGIVHHVLENLVADDHVEEVIIERYRGTDSW